MAIVPDLSGNVPATPGSISPTDRDYAIGSYNRVIAGDPNATLTPLFVGEIVLDTLSKSLWYALRSDNASWVAASVEV
jgi:hypothetical protein